MPRTVLLASATCEPVARLFRPITARNSFHRSRFARKFGWPCGFSAARDPSCCLKLWTENLDRRHLLDDNGWKSGIFLHIVSHTGISVSDSD